MHETSTDNSSMYDGPAPTPHRVLVTGASGAVARPTCIALRKRGHYVRGFSRRPAEWVDDMVCGDLADRAAVDRAVDGMDTVIHLGAYPDPADFIDVLLGPNVIGLHYVLEASRESSTVKRVVLASSMQVISGLRRKMRQESRDKVIFASDGVAPTNDYALTKVWAEVAGEMYARVHGLSILAIRIGWLPRNITEATRLKSRNGFDVYLSHDDAGRFHVRTVESERPEPGEFAALYAVSLPKYRLQMDTTEATALIGYEPRDVFPDGLGFDVSELRD